jgi:transposase
MPRALSMDLRDRMVEAVKSGASRNATAKRFAVSVSTVVKLMQRWQETGSAAPSQMGGWKDHALAGHEVMVRALIEAQPDLTLAEIRTALAARGVQVGRSSVDRFLKARGLTRKKSRSGPRSRIGRT